MKKNLPTAIRGGRTAERAGQNKNWERDVPGPTILTFGELEIWILLELRRRALGQYLAEVREADELMLYGDGKADEYPSIFDSILEAAK